MFIHCSLHLFIHQHENNNLFWHFDAYLSQFKCKTLIKLDYYNVFIIDDDVEPLIAPLESDIDECTPPKQHNVSFHGIICLFNLCLCASCEYL